MKTLTTLLLTLTVFVSCGKKDNDLSDPVDIIGATYYSKTSHFNYLEPTGNGNTGGTIRFTFKDFKLAEGVYVDCVVEGAVTKKNDYFTFFNAQIVPSGDTTTDLECSKALSGETRVNAGDDWLNYRVTDKENYRATL